MDNYEQKYKEALERMKSWVRGEHPECFSEAQKAAEFIFPELKESEDEQSKNWILEYLYDGLRRTDEQFKDEFKAAITWLEKQGEQNFDYEHAYIPQKDFAPIEPKFKVGDWISGYYTNYKVTAINSKGYVVEDTDGNKINILFENEKFHHLWTIQDAKDGDVLSGETDGEVFIFLFNQIQDKWIVAHGYYSETDGEFIEKAYFHRHQGNLFSPATKEQRDALFAKMKEAGWEWNCEKKELKKIETTAWNEEDEKIALSTKQIMNCASLLNIVPDEIERVRTWLKILKQRI